MYALAIYIFIAGNFCCCCSMYMYLFLVLECESFVDICLQKIAAYQWNVCAKMVNATSFCVRFFFWHDFSSGQRLTKFLFCFVFVFIALDRRSLLSLPILCTFRHERHEMEFLTRNCSISWQTHHSDLCLLSLTSSMLLAYNAFPKLMSSCNESRNKAALIVKYSKTAPN